MKELYTFDIDRPVIVTRTTMRKKRGSDEKVPVTKEVEEIEKCSVVFSKPNQGLLEDAEFFYGQRYNFFLNNGFLSRAMIDKKMGDLGGFSSKAREEELAELLGNFYDAARMVEFYGAADGEELSEEKKKELKEAKELQAVIQKRIVEQDVNMSRMYAQTAENRSMDDLVKWLLLHCSFYRDEVEVEEEGKKIKKDRLFPLFEGNTFEERRDYLNAAMDDIEGEIAATDAKRVQIIQKSYETLTRVSSIWYNDMGDDQESIDKTIADLFPKEDKQDEEDPRETALRDSEGGDEV